MCLACAENLVGDVNLYCVIVRHIIPPHYLKPEINPREKLTTITLCAWFVYTQSSIVNLSRVYEEQYRKEQRKRKERRERERERRSDVRRCENKHTMKGKINYQEKLWDHIILFNGRFVW